MAYEGNRYAGLNRKGPQDKAGWLGAAGTVAGAGLGLLAGPGGMAAGAKLGGALGGVTHDAVNGTLTPMSVAGDVMQGVSGFKGLNGAMDNKSILEAFMRDPHSFRVPAFANGGLVTGQGMDMASQWAQMDPVQRAILQAQQAVGPAPTAPTPQPLQQAQHPTLEALSSLLPQIMAAMPRAANPRNTKAIGAWAPAIGLAASAPAAIAQSRRASANAPIQASNESALSDYDARRKAYEERKTKYGSVALEAAMKPVAGEKMDRFNTPITPALRKQLRDLGVPIPDNVRTFGELDEIQQSMTRNATSSAARAAASGPKGPSPSDLISVGNQAETQYRLNPAVQKFETMSDALGKIAGSEPSGVGDLAMIFQFMKILDPTSVVREGEFATAENSSGRFRQMWNMWNKFKQGDKLTPSSRLEFLSHAKRYYKEAEVKYGRARSQYERRLQQYGIDPTMYLMDYTLPKETMGFVDNELNPPPAAPAAKPYEPDTKAMGVWRGR